MSIFAFWLVSLSLVYASPPGYFEVGPLADLSGFFALALIAATGVMMLFKAGLARWAGSPEAVWRLHIPVAGAGGLLRGLHVVLFLAFPISLPVFVGYTATGAALFVWITGGIYFQGVRSSMFLHGLLSIGAIFLIVLHTFGAGRNIPAQLSGISLALSAVALLAGVSWRLARGWTPDGKS